jgi:hypothetical protein
MNIYKKRGDFIKKFEHFDSDLNWTKDVGEVPKLFYDGSKPQDSENNPRKYDWMLKYRLPWTDLEKKYFEKFVEKFRSNIYNHGFEEIRTGTKEDKVKNEIFWFYTNPKNDNDNLFEITIHKCEDKDYLSQVFQMSDGDKKGTDLRYYLDDFGTLIKFLNIFV